MGMNVSSGGGRRGRRNSGFTEINITPFVDVMLVLLVIFMVTAPMLTAGVNVDIPESAAAPLAGDDEPLTISVKADGTIYIQETKVPEDELAAKLEAIAGQKKESRIFVRGDKTLDYGTMMRVVGELNQAGFTKVALVTDPRASSNNANSNKK